MKIELRHIHKRFGPVHANNDISMTVDAGKIVAVLGENGAGKSTLMKILSGYQPADSGDIILDAQPASYHTPQGAIAAGIGMLQQDPLDIPAFTVLENFVYGQNVGFFYSPRKWRERLKSISARINREREIIPNNILTKAPSAELRPNQKDSDSLPEYDQLDQVLYQYIEKRQGPNELVAMGFSRALVERTLKLVNTNEFKRHQTPPILRESAKAFGVGRRLPIVGKYLS